MPQFAANLTMLFNELPFLDRFAAAKAAGFNAVEYLFPYDFEKGALREELARCGLTQVLHNLPAGNWAAGERGIAILRNRVDEFRDGVVRAIDYAKALDCRQLITAWSVSLPPALMPQSCAKSWCRICASPPARLASMGSSS
ncbi:hydroxypyruvate isomerase [Bradyrhizobium sp. JR6.1]